MVITISLTPTLRAIEKLDKKAQVRRLAEEYEKLVKKINEELHELYLLEDPNHQKIKHLTETLLKPATEFKELGIKKKNPEFVERTLPLLQALAHTLELYRKAQLKEGNVDYETFYKAFTHVYANLKEQYHQQKGEPLISPFWYARGEVEKIFNEKLKHKEKEYERKIEEKLKQLFPTIRTGISWYAAWGIYYLEKLLGIDPLDTQNSPFADELIYTATDLHIDHKKNPEVHRTLSRIRQQVMDNTKQAYLELRRKAEKPVERTVEREKPPAIEYLEDLPPGLAHTLLSLNLLRAMAEAGGEEGVPRDALEALKKHLEHPANNTFDTLHLHYAAALEKAPTHPLHYLLDLLEQEVEDPEELAAIAMAKKKARRALEKLEKGAKPTPSEEKALETAIAYLQHRIAAHPERYMEAAHATASHPPELTAKAVKETLIPLLEHLKDLATGKKRPADLAILHAAALYKGLAQTLGDTGMNPEELAETLVEEIAGEIGDERVREAYRTALQHYRETRGRVAEKPEEYVERLRRAIAHLTRELKRKKLPPLAGPYQLYIALHTLLARDTPRETAEFLGRVLDAHSVKLRTPQGEERVAPLSAMMARNMELLYRAARVEEKEKRKGELATYTHGGLLGAVFERMTYSTVKRLLTYPGESVPLERVERALERSRKTIARMEMRKKG